MISFYPGPSRVYDEITDYVAAAHRKGILSINHRSPEFARLTRKTIALLRNRLDIPPGYNILFASSATECWEVISQSIVKEKSLHYYNGAFGEKWYDYARKLQPASEGVRFDVNALPKSEDLRYADGEVICITQNETSNGTQLSPEFITTLRQEHESSLIAVDATSSMAGIHLPLSCADIWFASVQKCFGLPAGLSVLILSPRAMQRIAAREETSHYNSLTLMADMMTRWQTPCTPNVLSIYLLMRTLKDRPSIKEVDRKTRKRAAAWYKFFSESKRIHIYASEASVRSSTVLTLQAEPPLVARMKKKARRQGLILGDGYGALKPATFRIANFPALKASEIRQLKKFLNPYL